MNTSNTNTTVLFKQTKTKTYAKFNDSFFVTNNHWSNREFSEVDQATIDHQQLSVLINESCWTNVGEHANLESAYHAFIAKLIEEKEARQAQSQKWKADLIHEQEMAWNAIKDLEVIPATVENIKTLLTHLNSINWGSWDLPKMSITYSAAQYDCDGVQATAIKLDKAIDGEKLYKVGGKRGHLAKYQPL